MPSARPATPSSEIGNKDTVLIIVDLMEIYEPPGPEDVPASRMPSIVEKKGEPVALDFTGLPEPKADAPLEPRRQGGRRRDRHHRHDHQGQLPRPGLRREGALRRELLQGPGRVPARRGGPGLDLRLSGVKVGSRVLLAIPPELGYGAQEQAGIPANSTLYFVVDILSAK